MNEKQLALIIGVQDRISIVLEMMSKDPMYAPPAWSFENWWNTLEAVKRLTDTESC